MANKRLSAHSSHAAASPARRRHILLDALRGFALIGICLANFPEFSLYTFQPSETLAAMPSAGIDSIMHWMMLMLIDGKFYTIFSVLFGIGFSIILSNAHDKGINGNRLFFRRMFGLAVIGFLHLMLLWSGDILLLYALMGMLLPFFMRLSDKRMLLWAVVFLAMPVAWDTVAWLLSVDPASAAYDAWWNKAHAYGINSENFGTWLREADSYAQIWAFLVQGAHERIWEFVDSSRYFKVLGLFIIGAYIGRRRVYARLDEYKFYIRRMAIRGLALGLPMSLLYAMVCSGQFEVVRPVKSLVYLISVYPLGLGYCALFTWCYMHAKRSRIWQTLSYPGRMALSNYVGQSVFGILIFYGIGFGYGATLGLVATTMIALAVMVAEIAISAVWLRYFTYGPLEWIWRMWNYRCLIPLRRSTRDEERS